MKKTIKELSDDLSISKTAINKKIDENFKRKHFSKNGNKFLIDEDGQKIIKSMFIIPNQKQQSKTKTNENHVDDLVLVLKKQISMMNSQLKSKDDQLKQMQKLLDQQQVLTLQANKKIEQLELQQVEKENDVSEELQKVKEELEVVSQEQSKKNFWQRLFGN